MCTITQGNATQNNSALVIQHIEQSQGFMQTAKQSVSITQTNDSGSNFLRVFQTINQSTHDQDVNGKQTQSNLQHVALTPFGLDGPGLSQMSSTGSNFAELTQDSTQAGNNASVQNQTADQFAGDSGSGNGINQTTTGGSNSAALTHIQQQQLDNSASQTQTATQDGDITQNGAAGANLASGSQSQDQKENGPAGADQHQTGDPRCCSVQATGGTFVIRQATNQFANNPTSGQQSEIIVGNCDSPPNGCTVTQSATVNGTTTTGIPCNAQPSCHKEISCGEGECFAFTPDSSVAVRLSDSSPAARLTGSVTRLT